MRTWAIILPALACVFVAVAQHNGPHPPPPPHGGPHGGPHGPGGPAGPGGEFFEEVMMARMAKELELNDEQTVLMVRKFSEHRDRVRALNKEQRDKTRRLTEMVNAGADDAEITALLEEIVAFPVKAAEARTALFLDMSEGLDTVKRVKLFLFLDRFETDMRRMIGEARERVRGGDGTRGPGGPGREVRGPRPEGPKGPRPPGDAPAPEPPAK
jgi:Spy/CpxP family protein refolding chaperone